MRVLFAALLVAPLGLDLYVPSPADNPVTAEKIALGRRLFHDRRLSADGSIACSSCHQPSYAFADPRAVSVGVFGRTGRRNAPPLINRAYGRFFRWDGRARTLEEQVLAPIEDKNEMASTPAQAAARVGLSVERLGQALASYVRSILAGDSSLDRFTNGDRTALSSQQQVGLAIFRGKGHCVRCHLGSILTDESFHNTGIAWHDGAPLDDGRYGVTRLDSDRRLFKTPTLREVARTAPYMHDGSVPSLTAAVDYYDRGGNPDPYRDAEIRPLHLTTAEKRALVAFLGSLTGTIREGGR